MIKLSNIKAVGFVVSEKIFQDFTIQVYVKLITLGVGPFLARGHNLNKMFLSVAMVTRVLNGMEPFEHFFYRGPSQEHLCKV